MKDSTINLGDVKPMPAHEDAVPRAAKKKKHVGRWVIAIVAIVVAFCLWSLIAGYMSWRAIFLTNNQVYFGHFWDVPFSSAITLHDVYYLEVAEPDQQLTGVDQSQQLKLVRLGNEIHGPTDEMTIPMGQVLFWETLRPNSAVVAAIKSLSQ